MTGGLTGIKTMMSEEEFDAGMIFCGMLQDGCTREEAVANLVVMEYSIEAIRNAVTAFCKMEGIEYNKFFIHLSEKSS